MNILLYFFDETLAKHSPKRTKLHHFKKNYRKKDAPEHP